MKSSWGLIDLPLSLLILAPLAYGASNGTSGAAFLEIPVGAGPAALGSSYSALAHDAYAPVYNPAGLGFIESAQVAAQHLSYLEAMHYEFGSIVVPLVSQDGAHARRSALGGSVQYLGSGNMSGIDAGNTSTGDFSAHYAAYSLSYGRQITDSLSAGLTGKAIQAKIAEAQATAYAGDLGLLYEATDRLALSATLNNVGTKLTFLDEGDPLPMAGHIGAAYEIGPQLKATAEGVYDRTRLLSGRFGTEWTPLEAISVRIGYKTDTLSGLSALAGLTAGLGLRVWGQEFAYAWLPYGDLGDTQYFSMLLKFGSGARDRENLVKNQDIYRYRTASKGGSRESALKIDRSDSEYEQLMQLLSTDEVHMAERVER